MRNFSLYVLFAGVILFEGYTLIKGINDKTYGQSDDVLKYSADMLSSDIVDKNTVRRLSGNVVFYQRNYTLKSDFGSFFQEEDKFVFEGNVRFKDDEKELISKKVIYDNKEKIFYF